MHCAECDFENLAGARFCEACGARLGRRCPRCGEDASATAKFCRACGTPLTDAESAPVTAPLSVSPAIPENSSGARPADLAPVHYTPPHLAQRIRAEQAAMEAKGGHRTFTEGFDLSDWNEAKVELELLIA